MLLWRLGNEPDISTTTDYTEPCIYADTHKERVSAMRIFFNDIPRPDIRMTQGEMRAVPTDKKRSRWDPMRIKNENLRKKVIRYLKLRDWKNFISWTAKSARIQLIKKGVPIEITATFYMPNTQKSKPNAPHVVTPDQDNLLKPVKDALKGIAWHDDCQVCVYGRMSKVYAMADGKEGVMLEIKAL